MKALFPEPVKPNSSTPMRFSLHVKSAFRFFTGLKDLVYSLAAEIIMGLGISTVLSCRRVINRV